MTRGGKIITLAVCGVLALGVAASLAIHSVLGACFGAGEFDAELNALAARRGVEVQRQFQFALGGPALRGALWIGRAASGEPIPVDGLARIEVGVFKATAGARGGAPTSEAGASSPARILHVQDSGHEVEVTYDDRGDESVLTVLALDGSELVVARVSGDLGQFAAASVDLIRRHAADQRARRGHGGAVPPIAPPPPEPPESPVI